MMRWFLFSGISFGSFFGPSFGFNLSRSAIWSITATFLRQIVWGNTPFTTFRKKYSKKYILHNRYYLKRYKSNSNTPKNIRVVNRMFYTWTRLHVAVFINGSRSITIITPISWQDFFGPSISPNTTSTCLRAIPHYPIIPLTINWMVVKKKKQKWYYTWKKRLSII